MFGCQTLEGQLAAERIEVDHLKSLLLRARDKTDEDKESLKKATRFVSTHFLAKKLHLPDLCCNSEIYSVYFVG